MFLLLTAVPALIAAWALGGRLLSVFEYRWRGLWLIWLALGVQIVLFTPIGNGISDGVLRGAHTLTYVPILGFLWTNRAAGLGLLTAGVVSNLIAISVNGGLMPADAAAQRVFYENQGTLTHALNTDNTSPHMLFLGDVMALPGWFPFANAFSIGDVLLAMGLVWVVVRLSIANVHPRTSAAAVRSAIALPALVSLLVGLGIMTSAAPLWALSELQMGFGAFGLLGAGLAAGALCGILMIRTLAPERTPSALGVSLVFCALSVGLVATATLATTAFAGSVVLGISSGAAAWILRPQLRTLRPAETRALFMMGAAAGLVIAAVDNALAMWIVGAQLGAMGLVAVGAAIPTRLARREVRA